MGAEEHTPGPWTWDGSVLRADDRWVLALDVGMMNLNPERTPIDNPADARLIASAPDLLAALEALVEEALSMDGQIHGEWGQGPWSEGADVPEIVAARAAINKARGEA